MIQLIFVEMDVLLGTTTSGSSSETEMSLSTPYQNNSSSVKITSNGEFLSFAVLRMPSVQS